MAWSLVIVDMFVVVRRSVGKLIGLLAAWFTLQPPKYTIFTHLKLCLADAIHNFKWVKIIQICQNGSQLFSNLMIGVAFYL